MQIFYFSIFSASLLDFFSSDGEIYFLDIRQACKLLKNHENRDSLY